MGVTNAIDVSAYQHPNGEAINWGAVKNGGIGAAYIKATEGLDYVNPYLDQDAHGAHDAQVGAGFYHFAHPGQSKAVAQAKYLWDHMNQLPRAIGVALDMETRERESWRQLNKWCREWLAFFEHRVGHITIYCDRYYCDNLPGIPWGHRLWLADPNGRPRRSVWCWQHGIGTVAGINGPVDLDRLYT